MRIRGTIREEVRTETPQQQVWFEKVDWVLAGFLIGALYLIPLILLAAIANHLLSIISLLRSL